MTPGEIVLLITIILLFVIGGFAAWWYFYKDASSSPTGLTAIIASSTGNEQYIYEFKWFYPSTPLKKVSYTVSLSSPSLSKPVNQVISTTSWYSPALPAGNKYTFSVYAKDETKPSSKPVSISFVSGQEIGRDTTPEPYVVSSGSSYPLFNDATECSSTGTCPYPQQTCDPASKKCYFPDSSVKVIANTVCTSLGGTLATEKQITDAFNNGASWCTPGAFLSSTSQSGVAYGYPSYHYAGTCGSTPDIAAFYRSDSKSSSTLSSDSSKFSNIVCYGVKPPPGTKIGVLKSNDGIVATSFSDNLGMWSQNDVWDGTSVSTCTKPGQICLKSK